MVLNYKEIIIRLMLSILLGGVVGYERSFKNRPAGFRTHIIVCMGASVISMIQIGMVMEAIEIGSINPDVSSAISADVGRLGAAVISGIGFLGAGTILKSPVGAIRGLTTAASLWTVACIGLAIGMGYYFLSIVSGISLFAVLVIFGQIEIRFMSKMRFIKVMIYYVNRTDLVNKLEKLFFARKVRISDIEFFESNDCENTSENHCVYTLMVPKRYTNSKLINDMSKKSEILRVKIMDETDNE